jgi:hypothetical protein
MSQAAMSAQKISEKKTSAQKSSAQKVHEKKEKVRKQSTKEAVQDDEKLCLEVTLSFLDIEKNQDKAETEASWYFHCLNVFDQYHYQRHGLANLHWRAAQEEMSSREKEYSEALKALKNGSSAMKEKKLKHLEWKVKDAEILIRRLEYLARDSLRERGEIWKIDLFYESRSEEEKEIKRIYLNTKAKIEELKLHGMQKLQKKFSKAAK